MWHRVHTFVYCASFAYIVQGGSYIVCCYIRIWSWPVNLIISYSKRYTESCLMSSKRELILWTFNVLDILACECRSKYRKRNSFCHKTQFILWDLCGVLHVTCQKHIILTFYVTRYLQTSTIKSIFYLERKIQAFSCFHQNFDYRDETVSAWNVIEIVTWHLLNNSIQIASHCWH